MARQHSKEGGNHLEQESNRQRTMEGIGVGLRPAVDGQSLGERWEAEVSHGHFVLLLRFMRRTLHVPFPYVQCSHIRGDLCVAHIFHRPHPLALRMSVWPSLSGLGLGQGGCGLSVCMRCRKTRRFPLQRSRR